MGVVMIWAVAAGLCAVDFPSLELRVLVEEAGLSARVAEEWDAIGTYTFNGQKEVTTVKLYYADSDSIAEKAGRKSGVVCNMYPNSFSVYAIYRTGNGPWKAKGLYGVARAGFWKVAEVKPEVVTIQVRSKMMPFSNGTIKLTDEQIKQIYEPFSLRLTIKDGEPALK